MSKATILSTEPNPLASFKENFKTNPFQKVIRFDKPKQKSQNKQF